MVYERASRDEEELFVQTAKEVVEEIEEPKLKRDSKRHPGGRPITYSFRPMLLVLLLMAYHRKEYREMEAHLKSNPRLLNELGLKKAPSKSSIHRAAYRVPMGTLVKLNDAIVAKFKKSTEWHERRT